MVSPPLSIPRLGRSLLVLLIAVACLVIPVGGQTTGASFQGLGAMPGATAGGTYVNGISGDGKVVVGHGWFGSVDTHPYRWTAAGGFEDLGQLGGTESSNNIAYSASFDGSVVVGQSNTANQGPRAFRWVAGMGMAELPIYEALAVSANGSVAAGMDIRWTAPGQIDHLGFLGGNYTSAFGVSSDGQTVVGYSRNPSRYAHAIRWTPAGGLQDLGVTNGTESVAWGISGNGAVAFGEARDSGGFWRAFRWTSSLGMKDMGTIGGPMSTAHGASYDGSVIVGKSLINSGSGSLRAFRWTAATGMRDLRQELLNAGVTAVQNWILAVAADVSDDGTVIAGWGYPAPLTPAQPFLAVLPVAGGGGGGGGGTGGDTGLRSPTANAASSGSGDGNGFESSPASAHADDALRAVDNNSGTGSSTSCTSTSKDKHEFFNYGFTFPAGVGIRGIEVRLDARADSTSSSPKMCVQLSWDGGSTWTSAKSTQTLGTSMSTFTLGSATDAWGRTWTPGNASDANFRARVINVSSSSSRDFSLDWVAVRVHYQ